MGEKKAKCMLLAAIFAAMLGAQQAEAGVPTGKTPMQAYAHTYTRCYYSANGQEHGYISAEADLIKMDQIRSDGWAHGNYPAGSRRVSRWFKLDTIVGDLNFSNYQTSLKSNCTVYRTPSSGQTIGTAYNDEDVTVVSVSGSRTQIVYHLSGGGYKMGWVDSGYVNSRGGDSSRTEINNNTINTNPIIKTVSRDTTSNNSQSSSTSQTGRINTKTNTYKNPNLSGYAGYVTAGSEVTIHEKSGNACKITYYNDYGKARTLWVAASAVTETGTTGESAFVNAAKKSAELVYSMNQTAKTYKDSNRRIYAGYVTKGSAVTVTEKAGSSYKITYTNNAGRPRTLWVAASAVSESTSGNSSNENSALADAGYQTWIATPKRTCTVYTNPACTESNKGEYVDTSDPVTVLRQTDGAYYISYKTNSGRTKERWVKKEIFEEIEYIWPVDSYRINILYYYPQSNAKDGYKHSSGIPKELECPEISGKFDHHGSIDIGEVYCNSKVYATADGEIIVSMDEKDKYYGNVIVIKHASGVYSLYGHLSNRSVKKGDKVKQGDTIGVTGSSGNSSGPHLHFATNGLNGMNTWQYFQDKYHFTFDQMVKDGNNWHGGNDEYSKELLKRIANS